MGGFGAAFDIQLDEYLENEYLEHDFAHLGGVDGVKKDLAWIDLPLVQITYMDTPDSGDQFFIVVVRDAVLFNVLPFDIGVVVKVDGDGEWSFFFAFNCDYAAAVKSGRLSAGAGMNNSLSDTTSKMGSKNILKRVTFEYSSTQEDWSDVPGWVPDFPWSAGDVVDHGFVFGLIFDLTKATSGPAKDLTNAMDTMGEKEEDDDEGTAASDEAAKEEAADGVMEDCEIGRASCRERV